MMNISTHEAPHRVRQVHLLRIHGLMGGEAIKLAPVEGVANVSVSLAAQIALHAGEDRAESGLHDL